MNRHSSRKTESSPRGWSGVSGVAAVGAAVALSLFGDMAMYVILPVHFAEIGLTAMQVGILLSANRWVRLFTNRVAERLIRRHGSRFLFPASLLLGSALAAAYSFAPGFWLLLMLRMVWGLCWSMIRHTGVMTTIGVAGRDRAGRYMGVYVAFLQGGFVAGTFVAGLLFDGAGFRNTFLLAAAMSLAAVPTAVFANRRSKVVLEGEPTSRPASSLRSLLLSIRGFIVSFVGAGLIMSTLGFILRNQFGDTLSLGSLVVGIATVNGLLLATQSLVNGVGSPLFGAVIDRYGLVRTQLVGFAVAGVSILTLGIFRTPLLLVLLVLVFFVSQAACRLAVESEAASLGPRSYSSLATATDVGSAVGPLLGWMGIELSRSQMMFWVGGGLLLAGSILSVAAQRAAARPAPRANGTERP